MSWPPLGGDGRTLRRPGRRRSKLAPSKDSDGDGYLLKDDPVIWLIEPGIEDPQLTAGGTQSLLEHLPTIVAHAYDTILGTGLEQIPVLGLDPVEGAEPADKRSYTLPGRMERLRAAGSGLQL